MLKTGLMKLCLVQEWLSRELLHFVRYVTFVMGKRQEPVSIRNIDHVIFCVFVCYIIFFKVIIPAFLCPFSYASKNIISNISNIISSCIGYYDITQRLKLMRQY